MPGVDRVDPDELEAETLARMHDDMLETLRHQWGTVELLRRVLAPVPTDEWSQLLNQATTR